MGDRRSGLGAAVREAVDNGEPLVDEPHILDLFGDDPDHGSPVAAAAFAQGRGDPVPRKKGPGRPEGARNLKTKRIVEYLEARYRHPLLGMADIAAMSPTDLAQLLIPHKDEDGERVPAKMDNGKPYQVTKSDMQWAFEFQFRVASELAEYMATKQPRQLPQLDDLPPLFQIMLGGFGVADPGADQPSLGIEKSAMISSGDVIDHQQVPSLEVPQPDQKPIATTDQGDSDD